jgi:hypothetical protein
MTWQMVTLTAQNLVEEDFDMIGREVLRRHDDLVQITLQEFRDHVTAGQRLRTQQLYAGHRNR